MMAVHGFTTATRFSVVGYSGGRKRKFRAYSSMVEPSALRVRVPLRPPICMIIEKPTKFKNLDRLFPVQFKMHDGRFAEKRVDDCFINGEKYNLGNPEYLCYPTSFSQVAIDGYSRHFGTIDHRKERRHERLLKKRERAKEKYMDRIRYRPCDLGCGGEMQWCSCCEMYSNNCCQDYGTCMCS